MAYPSALPPNGLFDYVAKRTKAPNASIWDRIKDTGIDVGQAVVGTGEAAVGLADIPTMGYAGKALHEVTGYDPKATREILSQYYSPERQEEQQEVSAAFDESFWGGMGKALSEPATIAGTLIQSAPLMMGGRAITSKIAPWLVGKVGTKIAPALGAGIGEGLITAGSGLEQIRQETSDGTLTPEQYLLGMGAGAVTAGIGFGSGKLAGRLGIADVDVPVGTLPVEELKRLGKKSAGRRLLEGAVVEGVVEELPQSLQEQAAQNLALGKPIEEGLAEAGGMGMISGGLMGGPMAAWNHNVQKIQAKAKVLAEEKNEEIRAKVDAQLAKEGINVAAGTSPVDITGTSPTLEETKAAEEAQGTLDKGVLEQEAVAQEAEVAVEEITAETHPYHAAVAAETGLAPTEVKSFADKVYSTAKTAQEFVSSLVKQFGETVKKYALQMWNWYKQSSLSSERGSMSFEKKLDTSSAPAFALKKEAAKAEGARWVLAPKGIANSYASRLAEQAEANGMLVSNPEDVQAGEVVYLSVPGKGRGYSFKSGEFSIIPQLIERGAILRTDNKENAFREHNKEGEGKLFASLEAKGYQAVDKGLYTEWSLPATSPAISQESKQATTSGGRIEKSSLNNREALEDVIKRTHDFHDWFNTRPDKPWDADASDDAATDELVLSRWIDAIVNEFINPNEGMTATAISKKWRPLDWMANPANMSFYGGTQVVPRLNKLLPGFLEWAGNFEPIDNAFVAGLLDAAGEVEAAARMQKDRYPTMFGVLAGLDTVIRNVPALSKSTPRLLSDALYNLLSHKLGISSRQNEPSQPVSSAAILPATEESLLTDLSEFAIESKDTSITPQTTKLAPAAPVLPKGFYKEELLVNVIPQYLEAARGNLVKRLRTKWVGKYGKEKADTMIKSIEWHLYQKQQAEQPFDKTRHEEFTGGEDIRIKEKQFRSAGEPVLSIEQEYKERNLIEQETRKKNKEKDEEEITRADIDYGLDDIFDPDTFEEDGVEPETHRRTSKVWRSAEKMTPEQEYVWKQQNRFRSIRQGRQIQNKKKSQEAGMLSLFDQLQAAVTKGKMPQELAGAFYGIFEFVEDNNYSVKDAANFVLKIEGVSDFTKLDSIPDSLLDLETFIVEESKPPEYGVAGEPFEQSYLFNFAKALKEKLSPSELRKNGLALALFVNKPDKIIAFVEENLSDKEWQEAENGIPLPEDEAAMLADLFNKTIGYGKKEENLFVTPKVMQEFVFASTTKEVTHIAEQIDERSQLNSSTSQIERLNKTYKELTSLIVKRRKRAKAQKPKSSQQPIKVYEEREKGNRIIYKNAIAFSGEFLDLIDNAVFGMLGTERITLTPEKVAAALSKNAKFDALPSTQKVDVAKMLLEALYVKAGTFETKVNLQDTSSSVDDLHSLPAIDKDVPEIPSLGDVQERRMTKNLYEDEGATYSDIMIYDKDGKRIRSYRNLQFPEVKSLERFGAIVTKANRSTVWQEDIKSGGQYIVTEKTTVKGKVVSQIKKVSGQELKGIEQKFQGQKQFKERQLRFEKSTKAADSRVVVIQTFNQKQSDYATHQNAFAVKRGKEATFSTEIWNEPIIVPVPEYQRMVEDETKVRALTKPYYENGVSIFSWDTKKNKETLIDEAIYATNKNGAYVFVSPIFADIRTSLEQLEEIQDKIASLDGKVEGLSNKSTIAPEETDDAEFQRLLKKHTVLKQKEKIIANHIQLLRERLSLKEVDLPALRTGLFLNNLKLKTLLPTEVFNKLAERYGLTKKVGSQIVAWDANDYYELYADAGYNVAALANMLNDKKYPKKHYQKKAGLEEDLKRFYQIETAKAAMSQSLLQKSLFEKEASSKKDKEISSFAKQNPTAYEQQLIDSGIKVIRIKEKITRFFYEKIASVFGADLVVVDDPDYISQYDATSPDGRPKIVINARTDLSFSSIFAHELFHHVVNRAMPAEYQAFTEALKKTEAYKESGLDLSDEETQAEVFAKVFSHKKFWMHLAETFAGRNLGSRLLIRLVDYATQIHGVVTEHSEGDTPMDEVYSLISQLVGQAYTSKTLQHASKRMYTTVEATANLNELQYIQKHSKEWVSGFWAKYFPEGTKGKKAIMTGIENLVNQLIEWVKLGTKHIFAHFGADKAQADLAYEIAYSHKYEMAQRKAYLDKNFKQTFKGWETTKLEKLHDDFIKGQFAEDKETTKKLEQLELDYADKKITDEKYKKKKFALQLKQFVKVKDAINVTDDAGKAEARALGYSEDVIAAFSYYQVAAREMFKELKKLYPNLDYRDTHYGQSIQWYSDKGELFDQSFDWPTKSEKSQLEGNKRYLKEINPDMSTQMLRKVYGLSYKEIRPNEMFLNYFEDAKKLIALKNAIAKGASTNGANGKPIVKTFINAAEAAKEGYKPVDDNALKVFAKMDMTFGYEIAKASGLPLLVNGRKEVYSTEEEATAALNEWVEEGAMLGEERSGNVKEVEKPVQKVTGRYLLYGMRNGKRVYSEKHAFDSKHAAGILLKELQDKYPDNEYGVEEEMTTPTETQVAQIYMQKDLAQMINVLVAPDWLRNGSFMGVSGKTAMDLKNKQTMIEFAFSLFHMQTIAQETISSRAAYWAGQGRYGRAALSFSPWIAIKDSRKLANFMTRVVDNEDAAKSPELLKEADWLLGIKDPNILEAIKYYYSVGGEMAEDKGFHSSLDKLGEVRYSDLKGTIADAYQEAKAQHPNMKLAAGVQTALFTAFKVPSDWLMRGMIPRMKAAAFLYEYLQAVEADKHKIASGLKTKEEIARDVIWFVEDRFGEVNWQNKWMKPSVKTALQFLFRSFTWFTGSWTAFGKTGIDFMKLGWFNLKGEEYHITQKGRWGIAAIISHGLTSALMWSAYLILAGAGDDEVEQDEDLAGFTLSNYLFPRVDPHDPEARVTIPSYVTELYKIFRHTGVIGNEVELNKLWTGRLNSIVGRSWEALITGEDWKGVSISDSDDNIGTAALKNIWHIAGTLPISASTIKRHTQEKGFDAEQVAFGLMGFTDAPAAAKRTNFHNAILQERQESFRGRKTEKEKDEGKVELKRAVYKYGIGDSEELDELKAEGKVSGDTLKRQLKRLPRIHGKPNPNFEKIDLGSGVTIQNVLSVWKFASPKEKELYKGEVKKKYLNMMARDTNSPEEKKRVKEQMIELGIMQ